MISSSVRQIEPTLKAQNRLTATPSTQLADDDSHYRAVYAETYLLPSMGTTLRRRPKAELTA